MLKQNWLEVRSHLLWVMEEKFEINFFSHKTLRFVFRISIRKLNSPFPHQSFEYGSFLTLRFNYEL